MSSVHPNHHGEAVLTQKVSRVMPPVIKNTLLNEIKNHWGGKCLAVPPWPSRKRGNLDFGDGYHPSAGPSPPWGVTGEAEEYHRHWACFS